jgi:hypothetical protein
VFFACFGPEDVFKLLRRSQVLFYMSDSLLTSILSWHMRRCQSGLLAGIRDIAYGFARTIVRGDLIQARSLRDDKLDIFCHWLALAGKRDRLWQWMHAMRCKACCYEACHCQHDPSGELDKRFQLSIAATFGDTASMRSVLQKTKPNRPAERFLTDAFEAAIVAGEVNAVHLMADLRPWGSDIDKFWEPARPPVVAW